MVIFIKVQEEIIYFYIILKIKELENLLQIFLLEVMDSFRKDCDMEVVNHSKKSKGSGALDINTGRGGPYNYIFIFRSYV